MSDDQDGCEWVNVSSGTGLPGSPGQKAVKRLCVCVVCVCRISDKTDKSVRLQQFILGYRFFQTRCRNGFGEVKYSVMIL